MRQVVVALTTVTGLMVAAGGAYALDQSKHRNISEDACIAHALPSDFCERVGVEAYNVDSYEWTTPSAHSQIAVGQTACAAANVTRERLRLLGADMHTMLLGLATSSDPATNAEHLAVQLGRALHTIQDNCAHHGMPNPQHAWASLSDSCRRTSLSPDIQPAALACAARETDAVMAAFVRALYSAGARPDQLSDADTGWTHWPARGEVCKFLRTASTWSGQDQRWNNDVVAPKLREQLVYALTVEDASLGDVCAAGPNAIAQAFPAARVDTSGGQSFCFKLNTYCVGKADGTDEAPPWDDSADASAGGCAVGGLGAGGGRAGTAALFVALGVLGVLRRRRARARKCD